MADTYHFGILIDAFPKILYQSFNGRHWRANRMVDILEAVLF